MVGAVFAPLRPSLVRPPGILIEVELVQLNRDAGLSEKFAQPPDGSRVLRAFVPVAEEDLVQHRGFVDGWMNLDKNQLLRVNPCTANEPGKVAAAAELLPKDCLDLPEITRIAFELGQLEVVGHGPGFLDRPAAGEGVEEHGEEINGYRFRDARLDPDGAINSRGQETGLRERIAGVKDDQAQGVFEEQQRLRKTVGGHRNERPEASCSLI